VGPLPALGPVVEAVDARDPKAGKILGAEGAVGKIEREAWEGVEPPAALELLPQPREAALLRRRSARSPGESDARSPAPRGSAAASVAATSAGNNRVRGERSAPRSKPRGEILRWNGFILAGC
jgi:hypothetical protein